MSEMIERAARGIYEDRNGRGCKPWSLLPKAHKEPYLKDARVAIEAMREPTEKMVAACGTGECGKWARGAWAQMIEAALSTPLGNGRAADV